MNRYIVTSIALDGSRHESRPRSLSAARRWASQTMRRWPTAAVSLVPVKRPEPVVLVAAVVEPSGYRVVRRGPGADGKVYPTVDHRAVADRIAHLSAAKYPTAEVCVEPVFGEPANDLAVAS